MNNCPNCGANIVNGDVFCRECGFRLDNPQVNNQTIYQQPIIGQQQGIPSGKTFKEMQMTNPLSGKPQYRPVTDDELINEYIGSNAKILRTGGFSFCTFYGRKLLFIRTAAFTVSDIL